MSFFKGIYNYTNKKEDFIYLIKMKNFKIIKIKF